MPALIVAGLALLTLPLWMTGTYYVNVASQMMVFAMFALALNVLVATPG